MSLSDSYEELASLDVKALFTSIPLDLARESVKSALQDQPELLSELTSLTSDDVLTLIDICFKGDIFQENNVIYKREHCTPMPSSCIFRHSLLNYQYNNWKN